MTKEELSAKIAQGDYTECKIDGKYSVSFKIGNASVSVIHSQFGNSFTAMTVISTDISEEDYNKILKQALNKELEITHARVMELKERINAL